MRMFPILLSLIFSYRNIDISFSQIHTVVTPNIFVVNLNYTTYISVHCTYSINKV